jgi:hypothetical protein
MKLENNLKIDEILTKFTSCDLVDFQFCPFKQSLSVLIFDIFEKKEVKICFEDVTHFGYESRDGIKSETENIKDIWDFGFRYKDKQTISRSAPAPSTYEVNFYLTTAFDCFYWQAKGFHLEGEFYAIT